MKRIFIPLLIFVAVGAELFFQSCDKIDAPYRETVNVDTSCSFTVQPGGAYRKVLVEEFTGHLCGNCPPASVYLNDTLKSQYGDSIVVVSIHAGQFADICPGGSTCPGTYPTGAFATDYKCDAGNAWYPFFGVSFNPVSLINQIGYPSSILKPKPSWNSTIQSQLATNATLRLRIQNTFDDASRKLRACIETKFLNDLNGVFKIQVVLTEDSIVDWQLWQGNNPDQVQNYVHHHVLRTSLNSNFGTPLASGNITGDSTITSGFYYNLPQNWNADHCTVVAYVYNDGTKEVLQVEEQRVK